MKKVILLLLSILTFYRLVRPGIFSMQDDMHIFRLQQFDQCFQDKQIPCRFIPDAGFGYGYPLFNYYSPLPYLIGEAFHLTGLSFIDSTKAVFLLIRLITPLGMYLLARLFLKEKGAFLAAIVFMFAPYQAIDGYVRGAIAEGLALSLIPFSLYFILKYSQSRLKRHLLGAVFFTSCLLLSHNLFALVTLPLASILILLRLYSTKHLKLREILVSHLPIFSSLLISSFFLVPAILEKKFVTVETMTQGYFYYVNHFATLNELFISRFWGYGASQWGPKDDMSFQIGLIQWLLPLISITSIIITKTVKKEYLAFVFGMIGILFIFLTHNQSTFIWKTIPILAYFQFPWRFLGFAIIFLSLCSGYLIDFIKNKQVQTILLSLITIFTILLNLIYFKEDIWYSNITDAQKLTGANLIAAQGAGLKDYWPKTGKDFPTTPAPKLPWTDNPQDQFQITNYLKKSNHLHFEIDVESPNISLNLPLVYFPNWNLKIDQYPQNFTTTNIGNIYFPLSSGQHIVDLNFTDTPVRQLSNLTSIISLIAICVYLLF